jgi:MFS family permease
MRADKKNVYILSTAQMLFSSGRSLLLATSPVVAYAMAEDKALATVPTSLIVIGTALATIPAAILMRRIGRRLGFVAGTVVGLIGGVTCAVATAREDLWLFALGAFLFGAFSAFAQLFRFAATDVAQPDYRSRAISLVLAGGVIAAFVGPEMAKLGQHLLSTPFVGGYWLMVGITVLTGIVLVALDIPRQTRAERDGPKRPLRVVMAQPVFIAATTAALIGQGVMTFLMTATPIAMQNVHHAFADTAFVIEWHIFAMFAPGFFTGWLINRFGEVAIIQIGILLQLLCVGVALAGEDVTHFWLSMALVGLGWNFTFTAATSLTTLAYTPAERDATQGATNFIVYAFVALLSLSSGALVHYFGWMWVNIGAFPLLILAGLVTLWYSARAPRGPVGGEAAAE